jgi:tetratricopeptide (TPR) repeat protein
VPHLVEMQKKYADKGVVIVALSDEKKSLVGAKVKELKMSYIVGCGAKPTEREYGVKAFPTLFLVGPDGKIEWTSVGFPNGQELENAVDRILKDTPPTSKLTLDKKAAKGAYDKAKKLLEKEKYAEAFKAFEQAAEDFKDSKYGKKAKEKLKELRSDKKIMAKVREAEEKSDCENWLQMARNLARSGKKGEAIEYYERIIKEYPESEYAQTAEKERAKLET